MTAYEIVDEELEARFRLKPRWICPLCRFRAYTKDQQREHQFINYLQTCKGLLNS